MQRSARLALALTVSVAVTASAPAAHGASGSAAGRLVGERVSFEVTNVPVAGAFSCPGVTGQVTLRGEVLGRADRLGQARPQIVVTVNDFGLSSAHLWDLRAAGAYDFARRTARRGVTWLLLDLAGYGRSSHLPGLRTCLAAQASMVRQVVGQLHTAAYTGPTTRRFGRIVLWGQAVGGAIAELAAQYGGISALVVSSWSDTGPSAAAVSAAIEQGGNCRRNPHRYAYFGRDRAEFRRLYFARAPARVQNAAYVVREPDPCGDVTSLPETMVNNAAANGSYRGHVLLVFGAHDTVTTPRGRRSQANSFANARVRTVSLAHSGNAVPLEPDHLRLATVFTRWLRSLTR
jgi:pimeloyl-ACP methyl ester carboxylesterase